MSCAIDGSQYPVSQCDTVLTVELKKVANSFCVTFFSRRNVLRFSANDILFLISRFFRKLYQNLRIFLDILKN